MNAVKKLTDCEQQLRDQCKHIADQITAGEEDAHDWMEDVYDIEWITYQDKSYKGARLMVAGGGPNIWVNLKSNIVQGYWWGDYFEYGFTDNIGLRDYLVEIYDC
jgi:hypothetical protein